MVRRVCSQHGCRRIVKLILSCKCCKRPFCKEHVYPFAPSGPFDGEWPPNGHPCPDFVAVKTEEEMIEKEGWWRFLDELIKHPPFRPQEPLTTTKLPGHSPKLPLYPGRTYGSYPSGKSPPETIAPAEPKINWSAIAILLIALGLIWFFSLAMFNVTILPGTVAAANCSDGTAYYSCSTVKPFFCENGMFLSKPDLCGCPDQSRLYNGTCIKKIECQDGTLAPDCSLEKPLQCIGGDLRKNASVCGCPEDYKPAGNDCTPILRCSDRTIYGECSENKPYFCSNGTLVKRAFSCGCPSGHVPNGEDCISREKSEAIAAFEYLNSIRVENSRVPISWDDRIYDLAVFRSRDMTERNYFDHVTPEGKCSEDFAQEFGINMNGLSFAENVGGVTYDGYTSEPVESWINVVDGWMDSRGHRYALMYPQYVSAAIGCYQHICVFLGLSNANFLCVHGEEGLAYWETVPLQPDEIPK